jgi:NADPH:quinone reductase-like Zn-dependent oxidoreductase
VTGRSRDGAFALYTVVLEDKAAILPGDISFTDGAVIPLALESAVCALFVKTEGEALPGVATPALGLPYPSLKPTPASARTKTLVIWGGSSSVGSMTTQLATAAGINVLAVAGAHNLDLCKRSGAAEVFERNDTDPVGKIVKAVKELREDRFIGVFDAISVPETYSNSLAILEKLGGGHLACVHPPPADVPANVKAGMIFAFNDAATPIWRDYVTPALESGKLLCLPQAKVVGKGLEYIQVALAMSKAGVSAQKLVVEL